MTEYITIYDFLWLPVYLFVFYFLIVMKGKKYEDGHLRKYFVTAFLCHMGGSILYCMVIQYYYGYGDSFVFYQGSEFVRSTISTTGDPITPFFTSADDYVRIYGEPGSLLPIGMDVDSNLTVSKISALLSYLSFNSYLVISMFFGLFAFGGLWKLFKTMNDIMEKKAQRLLAIGILFTPSVCFWGSGLIKDSLCVGLIGYIIYFLYRIFIKKNFKLRHPLLLVIMFYLLFIIKTYLAMGIALSALAALVLYVFLRSKRSFIGLMIASVIIIAGATVVVISLSSNITSIIEDSKNNIQIFKGAYASLDDESNGSGFTILDTEISIPGLLLGSPLAIFTTLFRPFLWESNKLVMLLSAMEGLVTLLLTLFVLVKCRVYKFFRYIFTDPYLFFCFIFTMLMGIIIGFSTFNFGTLVRYRLPILSFYFFMLISIYIKNKEARLESKQPV